MCLPFVVGMKINEKNMGNIWGDMGKFWGDIVFYLAGHWVAQVCTHLQTQNVHLSLCILLYIHFTSKREKLLTNAKFLE